MTDANHAGSEGGSKEIIGACLGDCIHVAGILNFLQIAEKMGFKTRFLGPAVPVDEFVDAVKRSPARIVAISYRLTPENGMALIDDFFTKAREAGVKDRRFLLGCLPELASAVYPHELFDAVFTGGEPASKAVSILKAEGMASGSIGSTVKALVKGMLDEEQFPASLLERIAYKEPFPVLRAHFGLPDLDKTLDGMQALALARVLDVISIAPDQAAQEFLQRPDVLRTKPAGAGGVPIRRRSDLESMHRRVQAGNFPLLRIYSGTQDLVANAELFHETIHNAWAAIPIFWYSELDGRGPATLEDAIWEHVEAIRWHAARDIPVEINDPHQWGLRMAPDHLVVADAFLAARLAKWLGVKTYVEQLMFNTPAGNTFKMDLARVLAMIEIARPLEDGSFTILKETRAGLSFFSPDPHVAMGQLCASTMLQMAVSPHIMHVVSYCEGDHAATADDIITSCKLVSRVIQDAAGGLPDMLRDDDVQARKAELLAEARVLLDEIDRFGNRSGVDDPTVDATVLSRIVRAGLFDAPHLRSFRKGRGGMKTMIIDGKCIVVDERGEPVPEKARVVSLALE